jgi:hypothetical protein
VCKQFRVTSLSSGKKSGNSTRVRIHCFCTSGFQGKFCDEDVDECAAVDDLSLTSQQQQQPCVSDATCINTHGSFICNCSQTPAELCYTRQARPKYSASVLDLGQQIRNYKNSAHMIELDEPENDNDDYADSDISNDEMVDNSNSGGGFVKFLGTQIPSQVVQNAILGIFGGLCALLIVLSVLAAVVCKVSMSRRNSRRLYGGRRQKQLGMRLSSNDDDDKLSSLVVGTDTVLMTTTRGGGEAAADMTHTAANTASSGSNTSVDHDVYTATGGSATSSPYSIRPSANLLLKSSSNDTDTDRSKQQQQQQQHIEMVHVAGGVKKNSGSGNRFFRNSKARGSMTVSLLSNEDKSYAVGAKAKKSGGYFNIFKTRISQNK